MSCTRGWTARRSRRCMCRLSRRPTSESGPTIVVRTALDAGSAAAELRAAVAAIDRSMPVDRIETMEQVVSGSVAQPRFRTAILAAFAMLALVMASIGIYGVMNYLVIQRTREFGIRLSVGATRADVLRLVLGTGSGLDRRGYVFGTGGIGLAGAIDRQTALWNRSAGCVYVRGGAFVARRSCSGSELYPGTAGYASRSDGGFAVRVNTSESPV